jgi:hypothetical protein
MALKALNTAPRFKVPSAEPLFGDSYKIAALLDKTLDRETKQKQAAPPGVLPNAN